MYGWTLQRVPPIYTSHGRSWPLNTILVMFTEYLQQPRGVMVKQVTVMIS